MNDDMNKAELRRVLRKRRSAFVNALPAAAFGLSFRVLPSPVIRMIGQDKAIALYVPVGSEAHTLSIAEQLHGMGHRLCLPRLHAQEGVMDFAPWTMTEHLEPGARGIPAPAMDLPAQSPDVIIAPLLAFDEDLNRMGQGAGYYDRAFARHPDALRIGLAWSVQQVEQVPVDDWDVPLHLVVTECAIIGKVD